MDELRLTNKYREEVMNFLERYLENLNKVTSSQDMKSHVEFVIRDLEDYSLKQ